MILKTSTVLVWREKELFGGYRHEKVHAETISQTEVSMAKRFVFDNLIYKINEETYLIMNLISFRRETITKEALDKLFLIESKLEAEKSLSSEEEQFLQDFYMRKQILPPEIVEKVDRQSEQNSELHLSKIPVRSVTFNLTHSCNFNCDYCYQRKYKWKSEYTRGMSTEDVKLIVEYLQLPYFDDTELEEIVVSGGEPLLPANIDTINEICERVVAKKKILFTNGTNILTYKEQIPFEAFDEVQISLDGPDAVIRQVNHYDSSFDKIIGGIKYLQHMNKKITLVTMWTKELRCHLAEYIELLKQSGILEHPDTTIKFALAIDYYSNRGLDEHFYHWDEIAADLKKYRQILSTINSNLELPVEIRGLADFLHRPMNKRRGMKYKKCDLTKTVPMVFEPDGNIYWCLCLDGRSGKIGNYREKCFDRERVMKLGNRTIYKIDQCRQCRLRYLCGGGCMLSLISGDKEVYQPACGPFGEPFVWEHLEELI